ncbi:hypothetical protein SDC9_191403 [bioreactor metagenome]|uniref:Uncharacterized protein n=1 Tax=bioreactor metagenome TaxID=1076179 RepID=A0A645HZD0_9ZZZZ
MIAATEEESGCFVFGARIIHGLPAESKARRGFVSSTRVHVLATPIWPGLNSSIRRYALFVPQNHRVPSFFSSAIDVDAPAI